MKSCLILIDAQESFRHRPFFTEADVPAWLSAQNRLVEGFTAAGLPIVRVFHVDGPQTAANPFALASGHVRPFEGLAAFEPALTVHKQRHSALVGTGLDVWLTRQGIGRIVVSGIRTEQCCETTARHASDMGWQVLFALDATLTWAMQTPAGQTLPAAQIAERTATVLEGRFASVCSAEQALERVRATQAA